MAILLLGLSLLAAPFASAQEATPTAPEEPIRSITVGGTGIVQIDPDTARLDLGILSNDESLEVAQTDVTEGLASITDVLTDAGVAPEDITTSSYNVYPVPQYDRDGNYVGVERYEVSAGLSVIVRDIDSVGTILDAAVDAGANNVWGISFYVDDPSAAASQARALAVEDARTRADELATASGMVVTNVISISESYAPEPKAYDYATGGADMAMAAEAAPVPVSPGLAEIRVDVQITFQIEQAAG